MKQLTIVRHGKSSWDFPGRSDHERPLNARGERDAPRMAQALAQRGVKPSLIMTSSAVRAASTAELIADGLGYAKEKIVASDSLYLASPPALVGILRQFDEAVESAMIFGHNPGFHELVNHLASGDWVESFPTLTVARLELSVDYWGEVDSACGLLLELITPRLLNQDQ
ncbi:MAG: histidine phosphatase family protein [Verrucomicrobiota bacterium]